MAAGLTFVSVCIFAGGGGEGGKDSEACFFSGVMIRRRACFSAGLGFRGVLLNPRDDSEACFFFARLSFEAAPIYLLLVCTAVCVTDVFDNLVRQQRGKGGRRGGGRRTLAERNG